MGGDIERWRAHWQKVQGGGKDLSKNETHRAYFSELRRHFGGSFHDVETLELGAGRGTVSMLIALNGGRPTCIDACEEAKTIATQVFKKNHAGPLRYLLDDVSRPDFPTLRFPVVFSVGLLEHFENPTSTLINSEKMAELLAWHVVIGKTTGNDAFYRNDFGPEWYEAQGWMTKPWRQPNVFIVWKDL